MKKLSFILVLATLALFTQCKKQEPTGTTEQNGIQMVLTASNGSRTSFTGAGAISWSANDKIYVVTNGQCVGYVTNGSGGGSTFTGTLSITSGIYDFHYYYVGNTQAIDNGATSFTMDFSDQDGTLANLGDFHVGYGTQTGVEVTEGETVTAQDTMQTLVAMAYFDLAGMAEAGEKVFFYGDHINNQMSIDFSTNAPTYDKVNNGWICAGTATSGAYVMLLPNHTDGTETLDTDITFVSKRTTGTCNDVFSYGIIGGRFYCANGDTDTPITLTVASYDEGALRGAFSVSASTTVHFSQGNLQYQASTNTWRFAENQWNFVGGLDYNNVAYGNVSGSSNNNISSTYSGWIDLFGWGTSGYNHGATAYQPWSNSTTNSDYHAYGSYEYNLYDQTGQADWGYNAISNGGNTEGQWRTLTNDEWGYVFNTRTTSSDIRYAKAKVNGVNGIILLPDGWAASTYTLNSTNTSNAKFTTNTITAEIWANVLEVNGAIFLPAAGCRTWGDYEFDDSATSYYWSASCNDSDYVWGMYFYTSNLVPQYEYLERSELYSVRLIR